MPKAYKEMKTEAKNANRPAADGSCQGSNKKLKSAKRQVEVEYRRLVGWLIGPTEWTRWKKYPSIAVAEKAMALQRSKWSHCEFRLKEDQCQ